MADTRANRERQRGGGHEHSSLHDPGVKVEVRKRMNRLMGQMAGIQRMVEEEVYCIDAELREGEPARVLRELVDPVSQVGALDRLESEPFDLVVAVGYKPGVTDPVGKSARIAVEDTLGRSLGDDAAVYCSRLYRLGGVDRGQAERQPSGRSWVLRFASARSVT